jgi:hypothetical protein
MPDDRQTLTDWLSASKRLTSGRVSDPSQDAIGPAAVPDWWWQEQAYRQRQTPGLLPRPQDVEALPLGSLSDPVSQAAFLLAPGLLRGAKASADLLGQPGYSRSFGQGGRLTMLRGERGNLGPPPVSEYGEALPRSVVRGADGKLTKLYHGTDRAYPDFDMAHSGSGAGGDLYGPGIYMTDSPKIAGEYAASGQWTKTETLTEPLPLADVLRQLKQQGLKPNGEDIVVYQTSDDALTGAERYIAHREVPAPANVRPVYADLKRPFAIDGRIAPAQADALLEAVGYEAHEAHALRSQYADINGDRVADGLEGKDLYRILTDHHASKAGVNTLLQEHGYDGITHLGGLGEHQVYIAFSPEHVYPAPAVEALR